ncbi:hypothetical protein DDZ16_10385 [Marinilabilia rubra]|uniref:Uncharacterized protein n=1 Tax=Marinilabilia rubra TaxID=2162893 RepID=A0A2U2B8M2_9BACT|nr:hypothetical protein DDZ16_10385 [Marinilabilia rubra]
MTKKSHFLNNALPGTKLVNIKILNRAFYAIQHTAFIKHKRRGSKKVIPNSNKTDTYRAK